MLDCKPVRRFVYTVYNNGSCVHFTVRHIPDEIRLQPSMPFLKISSEKFSFGEWIASDSRPNPMSTVFTPSTCSKVEMIGMLPPRRTANGFFRKLFQNLFRLPDRLQVKSGRHNLVRRASVLLSLELFLEQY